MTRFFQVDDTGQMRQLDQELREYMASMVEGLERSKRRRALPHDLLLRRE
ncbi:hypothetical protein [Melittangium boletus]